MDKINSKQLLYDLFRAYYDARRNKRNTLNAWLLRLIMKRNCLSFMRRLKAESMKLAAVSALLLLIL